MVLATVIAPLGVRIEVRVNKPPSVSPPSTRDLGREALSRRTKKALNDLKESAGLDVSEELLEARWWSSNIRDSIIKVVELSERDKGENICESVPGGPTGNCNVKSVPEEKRRHLPLVGRKSSPRR